MITSPLLLAELVKEENMFKECYLYSEYKDMELKCYTALCGSKEVVYLELGVN